jgi:hypothetical protein
VRKKKSQGTLNTFTTYLTKSKMKKRLSSRIDALEQQTGTTDGLLSAAKQMLVEILGRYHALWWPWRCTRSVQPPICEIHLRQREYRNGVAGVSAKADGKHTWKDAHSTRRQLIAAGMLSATSSKGQVTSLFLTRLGECTAQALVGDRFVDGWVALELLRVLSDPPGTPVREHVLLGCPSFGNPEDWADQTEQMLPALTCGAARACSDTLGRILYTPAPDVELPEAVPVAIEHQDWADDVYIDAFNAERHVLANCEPRDPAECFVPIPATVLWPKEGENDYEEI